MSKFTLIKDAYNANPTSIRAALEMLSLRPVAQRGRRIAVLADMLALGPNSEVYHRALAGPILRSGVDKVYLAGEHMRALWDILPARLRGRYLSRAADLVAVLESEIVEGDVVLFKGACDTDLHKVVAALSENRERIPADSVPDDAADEDSRPGRPDWTAQDLAEITGGAWEVTPPAGWTMKVLAFTRRRLKPQALVIPRCRTYLYGTDLKDVRNPSTNAYAFLTDDTSKDLPADIPRLKVASVRKALHRLAVATRPKFPGRIVAVTGTAGKTTTCNMVEDLLKVFGFPEKPTKNFNTIEGVHSEVASLTNEAVAVIEVAAYLAWPHPDGLRPDVTLITNIGEAHLEMFGSLQGIAEAKCNIFDLMPRGTAVIPRDSDFYDYMLQRARQAGAKTVSFGASPEADARLLSYSSADGMVAAEIFGEKSTYRLGALGRHFALNSVGALAVVSVLGLDWRRAAAVLATSMEISGRGEVLAGEIGNRKFTIIDDTYNANPRSMRAALEILSRRPVARGGRRIAVLADMLELGPNSEDFHKALADPILQSGADRVHLVGEQMRALWDILPGRIRGKHLPSAANLLTVLKSEIAEGDVVLFKGSHSTDLGTFVKALRGKPITTPHSVALSACVEKAVPAPSALTRRQQNQPQVSVALSAQAAIVLKIPSTGAPQTVYEKNPQRSFPPASLTKLLTIITALNVASRFERSVITMLEMKAGDEAAGSGNNIGVGDRFSFQDAIANMMLASSNATANVVARTFGQFLVDRAEGGAGPVPRFVQEMNASAARLGMTNSTFVDPSGLHASKQVTTAADMAKLLSHAAERPAITRVWGRAAYDMSITGPNARTQQITSSVKMIEDDNVRGGKTGTHKGKSRTANLAIYSQTTAGTKLASVVLRSASDDTRYADMRLLLRAFDDA